MERAATFRWPASGAVIATGSARGVKQITKDRGWCDHRSWRDAIAITAHGARIRQARREAAFHPSRFILSSDIPEMRD